jgi:hypothetical protein
MKGGRENVKLQVNIKDRHTHSDLSSNESKSRCINLVLVYPESISSVSNESKGWDRLGEKPLFTLKKRANTLENKICLLSCKSKKWWFKFQ